MKKYDAIIFDLDGTLWDASNATATGWNIALVDQGLSELQITADQVRGISGLPFDECIIRLFGHARQVDSERLTAVIDVEEKRVVEAMGGTLFEGVKRGIEALAEGYLSFPREQLPVLVSGIILEPFQDKGVFPGGGLLWQLRQTKG